MSQHHINMLFNNAIKNQDEKEVLELLSKYKAKPTNKQAKVWFRYLYYYPYSLFSLSTLDKLKYFMPYKGLYNRHVEAYLKNNDIKGLWNLPVDRTEIDYDYMSQESFKESVKNSSLAVQEAFLKFLKFNTWETREFTKDMLPKIFTKENVHIFFKKFPDFRDLAPYDLISDDMKVVLCFYDKYESKKFFEKCCSNSPHLFNTREKLSKMKLTSDYLKRDVNVEIRALILDILIEREGSKALNTIYDCEDYCPYFIDNNIFVNHANNKFFERINWGSLHHEFAKFFYIPILAYYFLLFNNRQGETTNFCTTISPQEYDSSLSRPDICILFNGALKRLKGVNTDYLNYFRPIIETGIKEYLKVLNTCLYQFPEELVLYLFETYIVQ